jgi:hypothetical protein
MDNKIVIYIMHVCLFVFTFIDNSILSADATFYNNNNDIYNLLVSVIGLT